MMNHLPPGLPVRAASLVALGLALTLLGSSASARKSDAETPWVAYQGAIRAGQLGVDGIFLVHPDGSENHEIATSLPGQHIHPDWSTDWRSLVFQADIGDFSSCSSSTHSPIPPAATHSSSPTANPAACRSTTQRSRPTARTSPTSRTLASRSWVGWKSPQSSTCESPASPATA